VCQLTLLIIADHFIQYRYNTRRHRDTLAAFLVEQEGVKYIGVGMKSRFLPFLTDDFLLSLLSVDCCCRCLSLSCRIFSSCRTTSSNNSSILSFRTSAIFLTFAIHQPYRIVLELQVDFQTVGIPTRSIHIQTIHSPSNQNDVFGNYDPKHRA
jgi:hypothetical protein